MRPIPLKYTLDTSFMLSNVPDSQSIDQEVSKPQFDGYFRRGESLYGKVMWNGNRNGEKPLYKLELEKIYICQSNSKEFLPFFDPEGEIFNKGPLFGCSKPHKSLKHRILALDKNSSAKNLQSIFSKQPSKTADGFKLSIDPLFEMMNETESNSLEEQPWYIQVIYVISVSNSTITKRSTSVYSLNNIYNNGTNMQTIKLTNKPAKYFDQIFQKNKQMRNEVFSFKEVFLKFLLPIFILIVFVLFTTITLIFYRKTITKNKFWKIRLTKKKMAEFPNPMAAQAMPEKDIYDNYENLMGIKNGKSSSSGPILKLQNLFNSSRLYSKRMKNKAFRNADTVENASNSNSTSGTLIAAPLLENNSENNILSKWYNIDFRVLKIFFKIILLFKTQDLTIANNFNNLKLNKL